MKTITSLQLHIMRIVTKKQNVLLTLIHNVNRILVTEKWHQRATKETPTVYIKANFAWFTASYTF